MTKLTQYSHGAGCGCKISPKVLENMLQSQVGFHEPKLLVGNSSKDDAAVYDLGSGEAVVSTTDFFMPIVDDPFDFGQIASVNAISDIYAMGGRPIMAIAILGWPINVLSEEVAREVLEGSRTACRNAGIPLAGGHSIDCPEPVFGLAVTGLVPIKNLKRNDTALAGDVLFLTKPLGVGILTTAQKKGLVEAEHLEIARQSMLTLNKLGAEFGHLQYVNAMTDVTGFGLLGHLTEMCEGSGLSAIIEFDKVPKLNMLDQYIQQKCIPGGTSRNWESYGHHIGAITDQQKTILCDPQTSGGLLVAVDKGHVKDFQAFTASNGLNVVSLGKLIPQQDKMIEIM